MGWFGGGSSSDSSNHDSPSSERGFSELGGGSASYDSPSFGGGGGGAANSGMQEFQDFSVQLQQQVLVQTVITDLSHKAFEKCCASSSTRDGHLTGKEVACIAAVTNKWLDANEFLAGRLQRKQQQAAGQQFG
jgi:Tim10/DDP family zinc finger